MIRQYLRGTAVLAVCGLAALAAGCGAGDGRPVLARVSGTVTYKGKPLPGASLVFYPEQQGIRSAMALTDEQGRYKLWTYDQNDGAPVGNCQVTVTLRGPAEKTAIHPSARGKGLGDAYYEQVTSTGRPLIPEKYFNPQTSGLTAVVVEGRHNTFDFALEGDLPRKP
jgi:hypothetical protein